jgi:hypothetical protein
MLRLERLELLQQAIVFGVRDLRSIKDVIVVFVMADARAEIFDLFFRTLHGPI